MKCILFHLPLPMLAMDIDGTMEDIVRMETEAQTHVNPFADQHASEPIEPPHYVDLNLNMIPTEMSTYDW